MADLRFPSKTATQRLPLETRVKDFDEKVTEKKANIDGESGVQRRGSQSTHSSLEDSRRSSRSKKYYVSKKRPIRSEASSSVASQEKSISLSSATTATTDVISSSSQLGLDNGSGKGLLPDDGFVVLSVQQQRKELALMSKRQQEQEKLSPTQSQLNNLELVGDVSEGRNYVASPADWSALVDMPMDDGSVWTTATGPFPHASKPVGVPWDQSTHSQNSASPNCHTPPPHLLSSPNYRRNKIASMIRMEKSPPPRASKSPPRSKAGRTDGASVASGASGASDRSGIIRPLPIPATVLSSTRSRQRLTDESSHSSFSSYSAQTGPTKGEDHSLGSSSRQPYAKLSVGSSSDPGSAQAMSQPGSDPGSAHAMSQQSSAKRSDSGSASSHHLMGYLMSIGVAPDEAGQITSTFEAQIPQKKISWISRSSNDEDAIDDADFQFRPVRSDQRNSPSPSHNNGPEGYASANNSMDQRRSSANSATGGPRRGSENSYAGQRRGSAKRTAFSNMSTANHTQRVPSAARPNKPRRASDFTQMTTVSRFSDEQTSDYVTPQRHPSNFSTSSHANHSIASSDRYTQRPPVGPGGLQPYSPSMPNRANRSKRIQNPVCRLVSFLIFSCLVALVTGGTYLYLANREKVGPPTVSPTTQPTVGLQEVIEAVSNYSSLDDLLEDGSPQRRAARWMSSSDTIARGRYDQRFLQRYGKF